MASELQSEIRDRLGSFLLEKTSLQDFEDWFAPILWSVAEDGDDQSRELVSTVNNLICEYSNGDRSENSMRRELVSTVFPFGPSAQGDCVPMTLSKSQDFSFPGRKMPGMGMAAKIQERGMDLTRPESEWVA